MAFTLFTLCVPRVIPVHVQSHFPGERLDWSNTRVLGCTCTSHRHVTLERPPLHEEKIDVTVFLAASL